MILVEIFWYLPDRWSTVPEFCMAGPYNGVELPVYCKVPGCYDGPNGHKCFIEAEDVNAGLRAAKELHPTFKIQLAPP